MSILIKSMEMPKTCEACDFCHWSNIHQTGICDRCDDEPVCMDYGTDYRRGRASFCPLEEVAECEDAVSRRRLLSDLKELIVAWEKYPVMAEQIKGVEVAIGYVETIPSVTPKQRTGKWIKLDMHKGMADHKCTACEQECYVPTCMGEPLYAFCPNCGSYNGGEQDERDS